MRDLHTNYILPAAYNDKYAFLPFRIEEFANPRQIVGANRLNGDRSRRHLHCGTIWIEPHQASILSKPKPSIAALDS